MKTKYALAVTLTALISFTFFSFIHDEKKTHTQTEEYAFLMVYNNGTFHITTTIGDHYFTYQKINAKNKTSTDDASDSDYSIVIKQMNSINAQGYELFNTFGTASGGIIYVFKKKL